MQSASPVKIQKNPLQNMHTITLRGLHHFHYLILLSHPHPTQHCLCYHLSIQMKKSSCELPHLNFTWECPNIKHLPGPNGPHSKMCKNFDTAHHTCMLHHILKVPNGLAKCKGIVPPAYHQWYLKLYNSLKENWVVRNPDEENK